jgi:hypothetical protein
MREGGMALFGKRLNDPVRGTAQVVSATGAKANAMYTPIEMTLVVQGPGVAPTSVRFTQKAARTKKFPFPGQVIPVEFDRNDPNNVKVLWDELPGRDEFLRSQGEATAAAMRGGAAATMRVAAGPAPATGDDRLAALERLVQLRDAGALTDDEFSAEKARILGDG